MSGEDNTIGKELLRNHGGELDARERANLANDAGEEYVPKPDEVTEKEVAEYTVPGGSEAPAHPDDVREEHDRKRAMEVAAAEREKINKMLGRMRAIDPKGVEPTLKEGEEFPSREQED
jgi:hypothetical protein